MKQNCQIQIGYETDLEQIMEHAYLDCFQIDYFQKNLQKEKKNMMMNRFVIIKNNIYEI